MRSNTVDCSRELDYLRSCHPYPHVSFQFILTQSLHAHADFLLIHQIFIEMNTKFKYFECLLIQFGIKS